MKNFIFYFKNRLFRKHAVEAYKKALSFENLSISKKKEIIFSMQKQIVDYAYYNTVFYKNFYDNIKFHPSQLKTEKDWVKVPVLEKEMIRLNTDDFLANAVSPQTMRIATTGGSTGKPLKVYKDKSVHVEIIGWRSLKWWGVHPFDNHGVVNRSVLKTRLNKLVNKMLWWPTRRTFLDATSVTEKDLKKFVGLIDKRKIKFLVGYCGSLEKLSDYIIKNNIQIQSLSLVWTTTSPLIHSVRKKMERAFNCEIMDQYGSIEVFHIAVQRPNENCLTVNTDYVHVDIVDSQNCIINDTGEMGDVLVTDLYSNKFPLIKYRLGDRSRMIKTMETSEDGFPRIDFVKGRISDIISFKDGSYLDGAFLTTICDGYEDVIDSYQIYQNIEYKVYFKIVVVEGVDKENSRLLHVTSNFSKLVGDKTELEIEFVDSIPDDRGKRRFIISEIKNVNNFN